MFTRCSLTSTFVSTSRDRYCVRLFTRCCHDDSPLTQPPPPLVSLLVVVWRFAKWKRAPLVFRKVSLYKRFVKGERELNKYAKRRAIVILHWLCPIRFPWSVFPGIQYVSQLSRCIWLSLSNVTAPLPPIYLRFSTKKGLIKSAFLHR